MRAGRLRPLRRFRLPRRLGAEGGVCLTARCCCGCADRRSLVVEARGLSDASSSRSASSSVSCAAQLSDTEADSCRVTTALSPLASVLSGAGELLGLSECGVLARSEGV